MDPAQALLPSVAPPANRTHYSAMSGHCAVIAKTLSNLAAIVNTLPVRPFPGFPALARQMTTRNSSHRSSEYLGSTAWQVVLDLGPACSEVTASFHLL